MGYIGEMIINSKKLEAVDVISFDIFDTLLKRNVLWIQSEFPDKVT